MRKIAGVEIVGLEVTKKMTGTENAEKPHGERNCRITVTVALKVVLPLYELFAGFVLDGAFAFFRSDVNESNGTVLLSLVKLHALFRTSVQRMPWLITKKQYRCIWNAKISCRYLDASFIMRCACNNEAYAKTRAPENDLQCGISGMLISAIATTLCPCRTTYVGILSCVS